MVRDKYKKSIWFFKFIIQFLLKLKIIKKNSTTCKNAYILKKNFKADKKYI